MYACRRMRTMLCQRPVQVWCNAVGRRCVGGKAVCAGKRVFKHVRVCTRESKQTAPEPGWGGTSRGEGSGGRHGVW